MKKVHPVFILAMLFLVGGIDLDTTDYGFVVLFSCVIIAGVYIIKELYPNE